jgi:hypothetical protein
VQGKYPDLNNISIVVPAQAGTQSVRLPPASEVARLVLRQTNDCTNVYRLPLGPRLRGDDRVFMVLLVTVSVANKDVDLANPRSGEKIPS